MSQIPVKITKLDPSIQTPVYAHIGDAGFDLASSERKMIYPGCTSLVCTGLIFEIPLGYEIQIRSRSGLALKGITVANSPGTIDSGFRGEVKVMIKNDSGDAMRIEKGDRIAQGVLAVALQANFIEVESLSESERGINGFGSSGV